MLISINIRKWGKDFLMFSSHLKPECVQKYISVCWSVGVFFPQLLNLNVHSLCPQKESKATCRRKSCSFKKINLEN